MLARRIGRRNSRFSFPGILPLNQTLCRARARQCCAPTECSGKLGLFARAARLTTTALARHRERRRAPRELRAAAKPRRNVSLVSTRFRALQHRNFQLFFAGQLVSLIGTWMQSTAQLWLVYKLTNSAALLGVFGFANQIPILLLASIGGYVGDRYDRHRSVVATQTASMVLAFVLAGLTLTGAIQGPRGAWVVIFIAFLVGIVNAFDVPIRQAFLVQMVGREDLPNAIALNSSIFNGARVVGPAVAGFAIAWIGEGWCFFLNGVSFLAVIIALLAMRLRRVERKPSTESPLRSLLQGFRFAMSDVPIRSALLLLSWLSLLGLQYSVFLPIFANEILHGGPRGLGLLMSSAGVGAVLGALHFAARTEFKGLDRKSTRL